MADHAVGIVFAPPQHPAPGTAPTAAVDVGLVTVLDAVGAMTGTAELFARIAEIACAITVLDAPLPDPALVGAAAAAVDIGLAGRVELVVVAVGNTSVGDTEAAGQALGIGPTLPALVVNADIERRGRAVRVRRTLAAPEVRVTMTAHAVGVEGALMEGRALGTEIAAAVDISFIAVFAATGTMIDALAIAADEGIDAAVVAPAGAARPESVTAAARLAVPRPEADFGDALRVPGAGSTRFPGPGRDLPRPPEPTRPAAEGSGGEGAQEPPAVR
jgi:hypothetical protein